MTYRHYLRTKFEQEKFVPLQTSPTSKVILWVAYGVPMISYAMFVLFSPENVIDQNAWLKHWANATQRMVLGFSQRFDILVHANTTGFTQVATVAGAMAVWVIAWMVAIISLNFIVQYRAIEIRHEHMKFPAHLLACIWAPAFGLFLFWAFFCLGGDPSFSKGTTTESRWGYLFYSSCATAFAGVGLAIVPVNFFLFVKKAFFKG